MANVNTDPPEVVDTGPFALDRTQALEQDSGMSRLSPLVLLLAMAGLHAAKDPDCAHPPATLHRLRGSFEDAIYEKDEAAAVAQIARGLPVNEADEGGNTPLSLAAGAGLAGVVRTLLARGANPKATIGGQGTVLTMAARSGRLEVLKLLLDAGADPNHAGTTGLTPLMAAAPGGSADLIVELIQRGAEARRRDETGRSALFYAASSPSGEAVRHLVAAGASVDQRDGEGKTPLLHAAQRGNRVTVEALLESGADPNIATADSYRLTPLIIAAAQESPGTDYPGTLRALLAGGADPAKLSGQGRSALEAAAGYRCLVNMRVLAAGRLNQNPPDAVRAFWEALENGRCDVVAELIALGFQPSRLPPLKSPGVSPLFHAVAMQKNARLAKILLKAGANPSETRRFLPILSGVGVGKVDKAREMETSLLIAAVQAGEPELVKLLLEAGADAAYRDTEGRTAAGHAAALQRTNLVRLLEGR